MVEGLGEAHLQPTPENLFSTAVAATVRGPLSLVDVLEKNFFSKAKVT